jgi:glycine hydroxymethyltransferase
VPHANVQPYSGSPANSAVQFALLETGDTMMGLALSGGGHLTHGHPKVTFSGKYFNSVQYGLDDKDRIDFDHVRVLAKKHQPKLMIIGNTAYPFLMDFKRFRKIADEVGAWVLADISHVTGLVVAGEHPDPVPHVDVVMSTTHKTFRGPRGAMILVTQRGLDRDPKLANRIDQAVFPALQGGPHNATTAGIAIAAAEAMRPEFAKYGQQVRKNATALANALQQKGLKLVGGGTETHLMLIDLTNYSAGMGLQVAFAMDVAGIYANRNTVPHEPVSPFYPSGVRLGTPMVTTRGMKEPEMNEIAGWIARVVEEVKDEVLPSDKQERRTFIKDFRVRALQNKNLLAIRQEVEQMAGQFPLFSWS